MRRAASACAGLVLACACGGGSTPSSGAQVSGAAVTIRILDSPESVGDYSPSLVHVEVGQEVAFLNASGDYHTVTFQSGPETPSSAGIAPGGTYRVTLGQAGVYRYRCKYHPGMQGEIDVTAGATPVPSPSVSPPSP